MSIAPPNALSFFAFSIFVVGAQEPGKEALIGCCALFSLCCVETCTWILLIHLLVATTNCIYLCLYFTYFAFISSWERLVYFLIDTSMVGSMSSNSKILDFRWKSKIVGRKFKFSFDYPRFSRKTCTFNRFRKKIGLSIENPSTSNYWTLGVENLGFSIDNPSLFNL